MIPPQILPRTIISRSKPSATVTKYPPPSHPTHHLCLPQTGDKIPRRKKMVPSPQPRTRHPRSKPSHPMDPPDSEIPPNTKLIPLRMTYRCERDTNTNIKDYKARCAVPGDLMKPHVHFNPNKKHNLHPPKSVHQTNFGKHSHYKIHHGTNGYQGCLSTRTIQS